jgi:hypothetical protein
MFADQYPHAGGTGHYAAYLENIDGFEAELVALSEPAEPVATTPAGDVVPVDNSNRLATADTGADNSNRRPALGRAVPAGTGASAGASTGSETSAGSAPASATPPGG